METKNEIKSYIVAAGYTITKLAEILGTSQTNISNKLARGSLRYDDAKQIAEALGYEIIWKRKQE